VGTRELPERAKQADGTNPHPSLIHISHKRAVTDGAKTSSFGDANIAALLLSS